MLLYNQDMSTSFIQYTVNDTSRKTIDTLSEAIYPQF